MEQAYRQILYHPTSDNNQWEHPRIISLGGDHSIVLPILRSLKTVWDPYEGYTGIVSNQSAITHGTFFWHASREGCVRKGTSVHGGLRTKLFVGVMPLSCVLNSTDRFQGPKDYEIDRDVVGFTIIEAHEIDDIGMNGIIDKVKKAVGDTPVYLSIDIDVLDPSIAPATGTPESGGWTTRELKRFLKGLEGLNMVGADVVEVSPPYDTVAETTSVAAADLIVDILAGMTKKKAFKPAPEIKDEL
ncbi:hypothetical protein N0V92_000519 [Colletotrichum tropicale]|nr:hypothetical protein N0V92_000519 [Colletotrichum tropicale]